MWGYDTWAFVVYSLAAVGLVASMAIRGTLTRSVKSLGLGFFLLFPIMVWLALPARRNIALLIIWTLPWVAFLVANEVARVFAISHTPGRVKQIAWVTAGLVILALVTNIYRTPYRQARFGGNVMPHTFPEAVVRELERLPIKPVFFSGIEFSDYMLFSLPGFESYLDGRFAEMYPKEHFKRYMDILAHPWQIEKEKTRYPITAVALELNNPMDHGLIAYLAAAPEWRRYYFDETVVIFFNSALVKQLEERGVKIKSAAQLVGEAQERIEKTFASDRSFLEYLDLRHSEDLALAETHLVEPLILLGEPELASKQLQRRSSRLRICRLP